MTGSLFPRRQKPQLPGGSTTTRLIGWSLVALAVAVFWYSNRPTLATLDMTQAEFIDRWNAAADTLGRGALTIAKLDDTAEGVVGTAWSPDLYLVARFDPDDDTRTITELAAVGSPQRDGIGLVLATMELVVAVVDPTLDTTARNEVLSDLSLVESGRPAEIDSRVLGDRLEFRAISDSERDLLGIGVVPRN